MFLTCLYMTLTYHLLIRVSDGEKSYVSAHTNYLNELIFKEQKRAAPLVFEVTLRDATLYVVSFAGQVSLEIYLSNFDTKHF